MAFKFNVFTSNFDIVEGQSPFWLDPVPTRNDLPAVAPDGAASNVLDEDSIFVFDLTDGEWHNTRISLASYDATINSEGVSVDNETTTRFKDYRVNVHPASSTTPGVVSNDAQNFSGDKTFDNNVNITENLDVTGNSVVKGTMNVQGDTDLDSNLNVDGTTVLQQTLNVTGDTTLQSNLNVQGNSDLDGTLNVDGDTVLQGNLTVNGTTTTLNTQTLDVEDYNITINNNGNDTSAEGSGLTVERTGIDGSLVYEDSLTSKFKIGSLGLEVEIADVSSSQELTNKDLSNPNNNIDTASADSITRLTGNQQVISIPDTTVADNIVLENFAQSLTNKTIDADQNTITNIEDADIKVGAAINAEKIHDGSVDNTEFGFLDGVTSSIQGQLDERIVGPASATNNAVVRYDNTTGKLVQDSSVIISDTDEVSGITRLTVDNVQIDGNFVSATGDLILNPSVDIDANSSIIKNLVDPVNPQDATTKAYVDIFREIGDLPQTDFSIADSQSTFVNIIDVSFANSETRSAEIHYSVSVDATAPLFEIGKLLIVQKGSTWDIQHSASGDNSQILFDITSAGQVQYKSATYPGFVSGLLKIRAITTSI